MMTISIQNIRTLINSHTVDETDIVFYAAIALLPVDGLKIGLTMPFWNPVSPCVVRTICSIELEDCTIIDVSVSPVVLAARHAYSHKRVWLVHHRLSPGFRSDELGRDSAWTLLPVVP